MVGTISSALGTCLDDRQLLSYVQGALAPDEREQLDAHLGRCPACCEVVAETAKLLDADSMPASSLTSIARTSFEELAEANVPASVGRYQLLSILGRGGTGVVYAAHDPELHRRVAIKLLRGDVLERNNDDSRARLLREARAMARVSHPHVVVIYDVGIWLEQVFVAMELVEGRTLRTLLGDESVSWRRRLDCVIEAGRGLCAAHAAGLVHRDFKPENVLVGDDGRVRVTDFGLAKPARGDRGDRGDDENTSAGSTSPREVLATVTLTGRTTGTPAYMAPEQFLDTSTDARVDQFAFCVVLHEALFGARPFAGKAVAEIARNVLEARIMDVSGAMPADLPEGVRVVILRGLSRDPNARYPSLEHLLAELEDLCGVNDDARASVKVVEDRAMQHASVPVEQPRRPALHRRSVVLLASTTIVLGTSMSIAWSSIRSSESSPPITSPQDELSKESPASPDMDRMAADGPASSAAAPTVSVEASHSTTDSAAKPAAKPSALRSRGTAPVVRGNTHATRRSQPLGDRVENPF
jgi:serine/threonine protein kinase